ncbi:MAG TPA: DUF308 domain-containing protein [Lacipirellulaceae bacterium]|nr:DUF308 domain-containing protein [Lacipirellulaceae bacterium]
MLSACCGRWWVLLIRGLCAMAAGIIAIMSPGIALASLVILFGIFALVDGASCIVLGFRGESDGTYWWSMILLGVVALVAGIGAFAYPMTTLAVFLGFVAAVAILRGVIEIVAAVRLRQVLDDEWILGLSGAASVLFGVLLLARPKAGLVVLALLLGAYMLAMGILAVGLSLRLRKLNSRLTASGAT